MIKLRGIIDSIDTPPIDTLWLNNGVIKYFNNGKWVSTTSDINIGLASTTSNGLMSKEDKTKLNGIANNANNYILPQSTSTVLGGIKIGYTTSGKNYAVQLDSAGKAYVNVPWSNTTYSLATSSTAGLVKQGAAVADISTPASATSETIATTVNSLLASLRTSGILPK